MRYGLRSGSIAGLLFGFTLAFLTGFGISTARADDAIKTATAASVHRSKAVLHSQNSSRRHIRHRYFIEFRARNAASYGHMYVLYGRVNDREEIIESHIAGFFPAGDRRDCVNCSVVNWTIGHLIFVPGEMGASDGDLEEKYVLYRYRVWVSRAEYRKVVAYIKNKEAHVPLWNALWKNCVDFGRDVAEFMHLKVPFFIWLEPKDFVRALAWANGVKKEQLPLKDAGNGYRAASRHPPLPPHRPKHTGAAQPSVSMTPAATEKQAATGQAQAEQAKADQKASTGMNAEAKADRQGEADIGGKSGSKAKPDAKTEAKPEKKAEIKPEAETVAARAAH
ncbi:MAG: hypothetical protein P8Y71_25145 [Pseudolabrys sp.]